MTCSTRLRRGRIDVIQPVILRLPQPRQECQCLLRSSVAAEDAEGPPNYRPERVGVFANDKGVRQSPPPFPASSRGVLRRPPPRDWFGASTNIRGRGSGSLRMTVLLLRLNEQPPHL